MERRSVVKPQGSSEAPGSASTLGRFWREPLVQFLAFGLLIFAGYRLANPEAGGGDYQIRLTEDDLAQIQVAILAQERPAPSPTEMQGLIEARVRQEVLYREALAMGLDQDDEIVKRRMAQKMEFLAEDLSDLTPPTDEELRGWFAEHQERFRAPARITFRHRYFSPDERGREAMAAAAAGAKALAGRPLEWAGAERIGDQFPLQDRYADRSPDQVSAVFGAPFAAAVFQAPPGNWSGPIESGLGWHVVGVEEFRASEFPVFEEVEADVRTAWIDARRAEYKRSSYEEMRAKYRVVLPSGVRLDSAVTGPTPGAIGY